MVPCAPAVIIYIIIVLNVYMKVGEFKTFVLHCFNILLVQKYIIVSFSVVEIFAGSCGT